jgi:hypothetical protein
LPGPGPGALDGGPCAAPAGTEQAGLARSPARYERQRPGELIHIDIKTLGRIDGVGHRITGQHQGHHRARSVGYENLHVAIDDASRLAYVELLPSLGRDDATGFLNRALAWYARLGARVERMMTDNG